MESGCIRNGSKLEAISEAVTMKVDLDRIEGDWAILLWKGEEVNIPREWLSSDIVEGTQVTVSLQKVDQSSISQDVEETLDRLGGDSKDIEGFEL